MEFVDHCTIHVRGGKGGNGSVSFRREAHVPRGGPDGGDGGRGGAVVLRAVQGVTSLIDLHREPHRRGEAGSHGAGMNKTGRDGKDTVLRVPIGTVVRDKDTDELVADLVHDGQEEVVAAGGRGGRGNFSFANRHRRLPRFAEFGEPTRDRTLVLDLKLIADVGLVGYPSAGKSSLITKLSAARPRIEAWPFTTLTPHLGVMRAGNDEDGNDIDVVIADVPGLIEGASEGRGLGHRFLRHIERCRVMLHVLDAGTFDPDRDPLHDLEVMRGELAEHDSSLLERPEVVALNKLDLPDAQVMADLVREALTEQGIEVFEISALTGEGLDPLRYALGRMVAEDRRRHAETLTPDEDRVPSDEVVIRLSPSRRRGPQYRVVYDEATSVYHVRGEQPERWVAMLPLAEPQAVRYLQGRLVRAGVERALLDAGAREGDEVRIGEMVFDFTPDPRDLPEEERLALLEDEALDALDDEDFSDGFDDGLAD